MGDDPKEDSASPERPPRSDPLDPPPRRPDWTRDPGPAHIAPDDWTRDAGPAFRVPDDPWTRDPGDAESPPEDAG